MSFKGFSWYQRTCIEFHIFFDRNTFFIDFYNDEENEQYRKSNILKKLWIRRNFAIEKTNEIELFLYKEKIKKYLRNYDRHL